MFIHYTRYANLRKHPKLMRIMYPLWHAIYTLYLLWPECIAFGIWHVIIKRRRWSDLARQPVSYGNIWRLCTLSCNHRRLRSTVPACYFDTYWPFINIYIPYTMCIHSSNCLSCGLSSASVLFLPSSFVRLCFHAVEQVRRTAQCQWVYGVLIAKIMNIIIIVI